MKEFRLSEGINEEKVFLLNYSEIEGRFDPYFNYHSKNINLESRFPSKPLYKLSKPFSGGTPSKDKPEYWNGSIPWVSSKDMKNLYLTSYSDTITEKGLKNSSAKLVPSNSIIIVVRSGILVHTLPISITTFPVTINQDLKAFVVDDKDLLPEYLGMYFYVLGKKILPLVKKHSTTVQSINSEQFSKLEIPIPPKNVQQLIIDKINKSIINKQNKLTQAQTLLNSIDDYLLKELGITLPKQDNSLESRMFITDFSKVGGGRFDPKLYDNNTQGLIEAINEGRYKKVALKDLVTHSAAGDWGKDEKLNLPEEDYQKCLVIRATEFNNIYNLNIEGKRARYRQIKREKLQKLDIQPNDFLVEKSGGSPDQPVGRIALLREEYFEQDELCYSNFIHKFRIDTEKVDPEYLFAFLKTMHHIKVTEAMQSQTNGIRNLIMRAYFSQAIVLPSIDKQKEIANKIQALRSTAQQLQQQAAAALEAAKQEVEKMILGE